MRMSKFVLSGAVAVVLGLGASACSSGGSPSQAGGNSASGQNKPMSLQLAVASPGLPFLQLYVAEAEGFYKKRNLTVQFINVDGSAAATAALQSGSADATVSLPEGVITAVAAGAPLKIIGTTVDKNLYTMYGSKGTKTLDDLAGKKVSILTEGNGTQTQAERLLDEKGAGANKSTYVATGALPNRLAAISNGQTSGTLLFPPFDLTADAAGLPRLYALKDLGGDYPNEVVAVSKKSITDNTQALRAFMDALAEASSFISSNFDAAVTIGTKVTGSPEAEVRKSLQGMTYAFSKTGSVSPNSLQAVVDSIKKYGKIKNMPTVQDLYDGSFVR